MTTEEAKDLHIIQQSARYHMRRLDPSAVEDADFAPNLTMREKVEELTRAQACQGCHSVINPLGFSLEQYDAVGRFGGEARAGRVGAALLRELEHQLKDSGAEAIEGGIKLIRKFQAGRMGWDSFLLKMPIFGQLVEKTIVARTMRTLGTLVASGVPILEE